MKTITFHGHHLMNKRYLFQIQNLINTKINVIKIIFTLSMKIRVNDIDLIDAERFDSFSSVIINCKKNIAALAKS